MDLHHSLSCNNRWSEHRDRVEAVQVQAGTALPLVPLSAPSIRCQDSLQLRGPAHLHWCEHQLPRGDLPRHQLNLQPPHGGLQAPHRGGSVLAPSASRKEGSPQLRAAVVTPLHRKYVGGIQTHLVSLQRLHQIYVPLYLIDQYPGPVVCLLYLVLGLT